VIPQISPLEAIAFETKEGEYYIAVIESIYNSTISP
jgi:hypothetical protein